MTNVECLCAWLLDAHSLSPHDTGLPLAGAAYGDPARQTHVGDTLSHRPCHPDRGVLCALRGSPSKSMALHSTLPCGVVWCGVVWCGVVWCGVDML